MSQIRELLTPRQHKRCLVPVGPEARDDFRLWADILRRAHTGVPINLMVTREPSRICWSDACPYGMGGYSLSGRAWRLRILSDHPVHGQSGANSLLALVAVVVNVWFECIDVEAQELPCM